MNCLLSYTAPATGRQVQPVLRYTEAGSSETLFDCTDPALALEADWDNARDKLNKCIGAAEAGKASALDQTCNAFRTQFDAYIARLEGATPQGPDVANRYGELLVRIAVINHVYSQQFLKSAPPGGFQ